jgi:hypothetical protein
MGGQQTNEQENADLYPHHRECVSRRSQGEASEQEVAHRGKFEAMPQHVPSVQPLGLSARSRSARRCSSVRETLRRAPSQSRAYLWWR